LCAARQRRRRRRGRISLQAVAWRAPRASSPSCLRTHATRPEAASPRTAVGPALVVGRGQPGAGRISDNCDPIGRPRYDPEARPLTRYVAPRRRRWNLAKPRALTSILDEKHRLGSELAIRPRQHSRRNAVSCAAELVAPDHVDLTGSECIGRECSHSRR
jgi:hypothetical protein